MIDAVRGKSIFRTVPARALTRLRGVDSIRSFEFGRNALDPALRTLLEREGLIPGEIKLDLPAKARLLAMAPTLAQRVEAGESAETIFSSLELSAFTTKDQNLYLLVDKGNIKLLKATQKKRPSVSRKSILKELSGWKELSARPGTLSVSPAPLPRRIETAAVSQDKPKPKTRIAASIRLSKTGRFAQALLTTSIQNRLMRLGLGVVRVADTGFVNHALEIKVDTERIKGLKFAYSKRPDNPSVWGPFPRPGRSRKMDWFRVTIFNLDLTSTTRQKYGDTLGQLTIYYRDKTTKTIKVICDEFGAVI